MIRSMIVLSAMLAMLAVAPIAQHQQHTGGGARPGAIKALTAEQEEQYRQGDGMSLAKAAELNHYPGPKHVLDLAAGLSLSGEQRARVQDIRARMLEDASRLGLAIIEKEAALDRAFAERRATADAVDTLTVEIGELQGLLRAVHLRAHIATAEVLSANQIARYDTLRGNPR